MKIASRRYLPYVVSGERRAILVLYRTQPFLEVLSCTKTGNRKRW